MAKLTKILRSTDPVSETDSNTVFKLLIPVVEKDPSAVDAVEAARDVITRCELNDDRPLAHVLDWWYVSTTGQPSANGGAYLLPETLDESIRLPMEAVLRLKTAIPAADWLEKQRTFDSMLAQMDQMLTLGDHSAFKLQGERVAWSWLGDQLKGPVANLRENRRADFVEVDQRNFEQQLRERGLEVGSQRYRRMIKHRREVTGWIRKCIDLQHEVEPWVHRAVPRMISEVSSEFEDAVGTLAKALLRPILTEGSAPAVDTDDVAAELDAAGRSSGGSGRCRLARVADSWCEQTGKTIPSLDDEMQRHRRLMSSIAEIRPRVAEDGLDEVELHRLDDDFKAAETVLGNLQQGVARRERAEVARQQFAGLRRKLGESSLSDDSEWQSRIVDIESRLESDDPHELAREIGGAQASLSTKLDELLHQQLEDLRLLAAPLKELRAPDSVVREWERKIAQLERREGRGAAELKAGIEGDLQQLRMQCRAAVEEKLQQVDAILTDERDYIDGEEIGVFANRRSEIESLLQQAPLTDADLGDAGERAKELLSDVEDRRTHRWRATDGEDVLLDHLLHYCRGAMDFDSQDIRRLYVSLKTRPFAILAGLTGSGKSSLTRMFAEALGANNANGRFRRIAVRPDWIDQTEVLGFVNPVSRVFVPGWLAETVRDCERDADRLHFVLLDEMNLAPVEQYLAEWLSAIEERRSGNDDVWLPLYSSALKPENADEWPYRLGLPDNLIIIGTVNVDETTRPLSERVLDRANVLLLSVEVSGRHHQPDREPQQPWHLGFDEWRGVCVSEPSDVHHDFLVEIADILRHANIGVGLRAHLELERFVANAEGILGPEVALDWGIVQRIIPKIRGFKSHLADCLSELREEFENVGAEQSASIVRRWLEDSVSDDEFLDGTDPRLALARI